ncbi:hypothetical protein D3C71_1938660 [compost metagenome]
MNFICSMRQRSRMLSVIQHMPIVPMKGTVGFFALIVLIKRISIRAGEEQDKDGTS